MNKENQTVTSKTLIGAIVSTIDENRTSSIKTQRMILSYLALSVIDFDNIDRKIPCSTNELNSLIDHLTKPYNELTGYVIIKDSIDDTLKLRFENVFPYVLNKASLICNKSYNTNLNSNFVNLFKPAYVMIHKIEKYFQDTADKFFDIEIINQNILNIIKNNLADSQEQKDKLDNFVKDNKHPYRFLAYSLIEAILIYEKFETKPKLGFEFLLEKQLSDSDQNVPYLVDDKAEITKRKNNDFLFRDSELKTIHDTLSEGTHSLILSGFGGIGKTSLATRYANEHIDEYDYIYFLEYASSGLQPTINNNLTIKNAPNYEKENDRYREKIEFLKNSKSKILIIIDNFDGYIEKKETGKEILVPATDDPQFKDFIDAANNSNFYVIFTSRVTIEKIKEYVLSIKPIDIQPLVFEQYKELFYRYYQKKEDDLNEKERANINEILNKVKKPVITKIITVLAQSLKNGNITLSELNRDLDTFKNIQMRTLYKLSKLTKIQKNILDNLSFIPLGGISKLLFAKWLGLPNDDYLDNLIASGWISQKSNKIDLDPPIQEFIAAERSQNIEKYKKLTDALIESAINIDDYETTLLLADIGKHICGFLNKNKSPDSLETANIHIATGDALFNTKQYREALEFFLISEKILSSLNEHNEKIYDKIASTSVLYSSPTQSKYILTILEKEYEMQKAMVPLNPARIIYIAPMLASHYDNNDQHTKALEIIKHALMIVKVHEVKESYDLAELYHKASVLFCHIHSYYIALDYIYKFRDLVKDKERSNEVTLCKDDFYDIIGFIYSGLGLHERALENKKECLKLRKEFFQDLNHPIIARIYNRIGISYADLYNFKNDLDDFENAVYYLKEALKIREHFAAGSNTIDVATSKNNIGCCYYAYRDFKTAYEFLKEAYEIRKSIKTTPINELISSYFNIGTVLFYMEKEDEAWSYIKEAYNTVKEKNFEHVFLKFLPSSNFHNQVISAEEDLRIWITDKLSPEPLFDKEKGGYWTTKRANEYNV